MAHSLLLSCGLARLVPRKDFNLSSLSLAHVLPSFYLSQGTVGWEEWNTVLSIKPLLLLGWQAAMFTNLCLRQKQLQQEIVTLRLSGKYQNKTMIYFFKTPDKINLLLLYWARHDCIRGKNGPLLFEGLRVKLAPLHIYMYISCINELLTSSLSKQTNARKKSP